MSYYDFDFAKLLNQGQLMLLDFMNEKKEVTPRSQKIFSKWYFYGNINILVEYGLVEVTIQQDDNRIKLWKLTNKGRLFIEKMKEANKIWEQENPIAAK